MNNIGDFSGFVCVAASVLFGLGLFIFTDLEYGMVIIIALIAGVFGAIIIVPIMYFLVLFGLDKGRLYESGKMFWLSTLAILILDYQVIYKGFAKDGQIKVCIFCSDDKQEQTIKSTSQQEN